MTKRMHFTAPEEAKADGIEYMLMVGRRQPMHQAHLANIRRVHAQGFKPIIVIGSTNQGMQRNGLNDPLFEPLANPLTPAQQRAQIKEALPGLVEGKDYYLAEFPDLGDNLAWSEALAGLLKSKIEIDGRYPDISGKTAFHFLGREEDKRPRYLLTGEGEEKTVLSYFWEGIFDRLGLPVWEEQITQEMDFSVSGTLLRSFDVDAISPEQRALFAAPEFILPEMKRARSENPDKALLDGVPVTALDLSLERLAKEKGISTKSVVEVVQAAGLPLTTAHIADQARALNGSMQKRPMAKLKVASAAMNQTVYDFATNLPNILNAIDRAVEDGADVLALEELGLTGYSADDSHHWFRNEIVWPHIQTIMRYAEQKNSNLVISLGTPWIHADKELPVSDPSYNINNRPYNTQMFITGGRVAAMGAKSVLADGAAEYEPHQFRDWPVQNGTISITLPDGSKVPFGKPVVALGEAGHQVTVFHEQCAEAWYGVGDDMSINTREQQVRAVAEKSLTHDISLAINPSASKPQPELNKERLRAAALVEAGSNYAGAYVYTNYLGSGSGTYAAEGSQIFAQGGETVHHGPRYSFADVSYSSAVLEVPLAQRGAPDVVVAHSFTDHAPAKIGQESSFENLPDDQRVQEEYARSIALWMRDYMAKQPWDCQGYVISLSGGKDSAYGAVAIRAMVDLEVNENGIEGFFEHFPKLKYKQEVLDVYKSEGVEAAKDAIMKRLLVCNYLATENSSERTENAARTLIEGGMVDGKPVKGIGGTFNVLNVQRVVEENILAYSGMDLEAVAKAHRAESKTEQQLAALGVAEDVRQIVAKEEVRTLVHSYVNAAEGAPEATLPAYIADACTHEIPTWSNKKFDATLQNIQARVRQPMPWMVGNTSGRIPLVTSNQSEAVLGYATFGGDMHMGGANPIGGLGKKRLTDGLKYLEQHGLHGAMAPVEALALVNREKASAELRKEEEGQAQQTDESDLGFTYSQGDKITNALITNRQTMAQAFTALRKDPEFPTDAGQLRDIFAKYAHRWNAAQFKRIASVLSPYVGGNVDPHQSVRTTVLGDNFRTPIAELTLDIIAEKLENEHTFRAKLGVTLEEAKYLAATDKTFRQALQNESLQTLMQPEKISALKETIAESSMKQTLESIRDTSWQGRTGGERGGWAKGA
jgi:NH3-dependent NAD+ synthetase